MLASRIVRPPFMQAFAAVGIPVGLAESQQQHGFLRRRHLQSASVRTMSRDSCMVNSLGGRLRDARAPRRPASFFTGLQVVVLLAYCRFASAVICAAERPGAQRVTSWLKHDPIGLAQPRAAPPGETAGNEIYSIRSLRGGSANDAKDGTADATSKEEMEKMERDKVLIAQLQVREHHCPLTLFPLSFYPFPHSRPRPPSVPSASGSPAHMRARALAHAGDASRVSRFEEAHQHGGRGDRRPQDGCRGH
jgi:hypothetical protein